MKFHDTLETVTNEKAKELLGQSGVAVTWAMNALAKHFNRPFVYRPGLYLREEGTECYDRNEKRVPGLAFNAYWVFNYEQKSRLPNDYGPVSQCYASACLVFHTDFRIRVHDGHEEWRGHALHHYNVADPEDVNKRHHVRVTHSNHQHTFKFTPHSFMRTICLIDQVERQLALVQLGEKLLADCPIR